MTRLISFSARKAVPTRTIVWYTVFCLALCVAPSAAQTERESRPVPLITQAIDEGQLVELKGNVYPAATPSADRGAAAGDLDLDRMILVLKRSAAQELALKKFLDQQKNPNSPNYRKWLTPEQFGAKFGAAEQDIATLAAWLRSHGFSIESIAKGHNVLIFSGMNAQLRNAFHTEMHHYSVDGIMHYANATDPKIPAALAPVVAGIARLNDFHSKPLHSAITPIRKQKSTGRWQPVASNTRPQFTYSDSNFFAVGPSDFAEIYNVKPLWGAGIDGTGQTIAIVGRSDIKRSDVDMFRAYFGLPETKLNIIYDGPNPGIQMGGEEGEADLDVQWSGAVAKNATINYVIAGSTRTTDGIQLASEYAIDNNLAPVLSVSYGMCELGFGTAGNQLIKQQWQQAAAQGITVLVAAGDASAAGCDQGFAYSTFGFTVNGLASTPYNVAIGGTDLYGTYLDTAKYWSNENDSTTRQSVKSYMPELPWNDTCGSPQVLAAFQAIGVADATNEALCNDWNLPYWIWTTAGGSGGRSNCVESSNGDPTTCSGGYPKPAWQSGVPGIPDDSVRDLPDVSLFAGAGLWGSAYVFCTTSPYNGCDFDSINDQYALAAGGTSFGTPAFAGIMALINQKTNSIQGNANYELYKIAANQYAGDPSACDSSLIDGVNSCKFYDVTQGSNAVPCVPSTADCSPADPGSALGVLPGWYSNVGYDMTAGLGSINAYNLVNAWGDAKASFSETTTTMTLDATSVPYGSLVTGKITVAASGNGSGMPSGDTSLITSQGTGVGLGPFTLADGSASISGTGSAAGVYVVSAHYGGDATFAPSTSPATTLTITKAVSSSTLTASSAAIKAGETVTFNVTVGSSSVAASPTGTVTFTDTTTGVTLGSAPVEAWVDDYGYAIGRAALNVLGRRLNQGSNSISATYSGDSNYVESTATTIAVTYTPPFSLSLGQPSITVQSGGSSNATITLTANGGNIPGAVLLECAQPLPAGVSCSFAPGSIAAGSGTTNSTLTVYAVFPSSIAGSTHAPVKTQGGSMARLLAIGGVATFAFLFMVPGKRRRASSCIGLIAVALIMVACGGGSNGPVASSTSLAVTPASGSMGTTFAFTATVSGTGKAAPTGTVTFVDGNAVLGTAPVSNGTATFSISTLALGSHSVIASYSGDANFVSSGSASPAVVHVQYRTSIKVQAYDSLGNLTMIDVPVIVE